MDPKKSLFSGLKGAAAGLQSFMNRGGSSVELPPGDSSIQQNLLERTSVYGRFRKVHEVLESTISVPPGTFPLPRVVTIGKESSGKSSLNEMILKCDVFPRSDGIMTRCPVRFETEISKLVSCEIEWRGSKRPVASNTALIAEVKYIMESIGNSVVSDEIVIRFTGPDYVAMSFVDLPGIRTVPDTLRKATSEIVEKYLDDKHSIILCVVPATERLAADQAVGLVFAKFKAAQTILVLSKADQVTDTLFERLVVPRLLGADEETPRFGFAGCLATYCRDQATDGADRVALAEAGPRESEWARKRLSSLRQPPDALEKLRDNITVGNLLRQLERIYYNHIVTHWRPVALQLLAPLIADAQEELRVLGTDPRALQVQTLLDVVEVKVHDKWPALPAHRRFGDVTEPRNSRAAAVQAGAITADFEAWLDSVLDTGNPAGLLGVAELEAVFDAAFDDEMPLRSMRFEQARTLLRGALRREATRGFAKHGPAIRAHAVAQLRLALRGSGTVDEAAAGVVTESLYLCLLPAMATPAVLRGDTGWLYDNAAAFLSEAPLRAEERRKADRKLARLLEAQSIVTDIARHVAATPGDL